MPNTQSAHLVYVTEEDLATCASDPQTYCTNISQYDYANQLRAQLHRRRLKREETKQPKEDIRTSMIETIPAWMRAAVADKKPFPVQLLQQLFRFNATRPKNDDTASLVVCLPSNANDSFSTPELLTWNGSCDGADDVAGDAATLLFAEVLDTFDGPSHKQHIKEFQVNEKAMFHLSATHRLPWVTAWIKRKLAEMLKLMPHAAETSASTKFDYASLMIAQHEKAQQLVADNVQLRDGDWNKKFLLPSTLCVVKSTETFVNHALTRKCNDLAEEVDKILAKVKEDGSWTEEQVKSIEPFLEDKKIVQEWMDHYRAVPKGKKRPKFDIDYQAKMFEIVQAKMAFKIPECLKGQFEAILWTAIKNSNKVKGHDLLKALAEIVKKIDPVDLTLSSSDEENSVGKEPNAKKSRTEKPPSAQDSSMSPRPVADADPIREDVEMRDATADVNDDDAARMFPKNPELARDVIKAFKTQRDLNIPTNTENLYEIFQDKKGKATTELKIREAVLALIVFFAYTQPPDRLENKPKNHWSKQDLGSETTLDWIRKHVGNISPKKVEHRGDFATEFTNLVANMEYVEKALK